MKNKAKMNIEERKEVSGTKKYLLFFTYLFEREKPFLDASEQKTQLGEGFGIRKLYQIPTLLCLLTQNTLPLHGLIW